MSANVFSYPFLDLRFNVSAIIETADSELKFPFYKACYLIPLSKASAYLNGTFETMKFYTLLESDYSTKCLGEFLKGIQCFYNQPRSKSQAGFIIFDDTFYLDATDANAGTSYVDAPEANRLALMNKIKGTIGRNASVVCVAETDQATYNLMMDDFRTADSGLGYIKIKVRNSLSDSESDLKELEDDFQKSGFTILALYQNQEYSPTGTTSVDLPFTNRPDFTIAGLWLNPYSSDGSTSYVVGLNIDGANVTLDSTAISLNENQDILNYMTEQMITFYQVKADDDSEFVMSGGGVYYQGSVIPANMALFSLYAEYVLKSNLYSQVISSGSGVANVTIFRNAISATMVILNDYKDFLLEEITSKTFSQSDINSAVSNKVVQLDNAISMTTLPTFLYTEASFTLSIA